MNTQRDPHSPQPNAPQPNAQVAAPAEATKNSIHIDDFMAGAERWQIFKRTKSPYFFGKTTKVGIK